MLTVLTLMVIGLFTTFILFRGPLKERMMLSAIIALLCLPLDFMVASLAGGMQRWSPRMESVQLSALPFQNLPAGTYIMEQYNGTSLLPIRRFGLQHDLRYMDFSFQKSCRVVEENRGDAVVQKYMKVSPSSPWIFGRAITESTIVRVPKGSVYRNLLPPHF